MLKTFISLAICILMVSAYTIKPNDDAGDFTIFPLVNLGANAFPTTMAFSPDGRIFIAQKCGEVRVIDAQGNLEDEPWINLNYTVNCSGDKGLTALTLHPNFPTVPYIYTMFPIWQNDSHDLNRVTQGVLARYTEVNGKGVVASEFLLIGKTNGTGTPSCHNSHVTGDIVFANDGTLFASAGEGSHWDAVDDGEIFDFDPHDWECAPFFGADVAIGSFRAQHLNNLGGKVMRIDPATGNGIGADNFPDLMPNPYYDSSKPDGFASVIWSMGHRNPWKLALRPSTGPGTLYIAEVGAKDYEEINVVTPALAGHNWGWPCLTGDKHLQPWFTNTSVPTEYFVPIYPTNQHTIDVCNGFLPDLKANSIEPIFFYSRSQYVYGEFIGVIGNCASGLSFYNGSDYPAAYRPQADGTRTLFISDFGNQWIKTIRVDANDQYMDSYGVTDFLDNVGTILQIKTSPTNGDIYYITEEGEINRIRYTAGYVGAPIIGNLGANPQTVNIANHPATIQFSSDGSFDPAGLALNFSWNFGDNTFSTDPNPSHTYTTAGTFKVTLTLTNAAGYAATSSITVATNNDAPQAFFSGKQWFTFTMGQQVTLNANFEDAETPAANLQWSWEYRIVHNNHYHPEVITVPSIGLGTGATTSDTETYSSIISQYERNMLEIFVTVTDAAGASTRAMVRAVPNYPGNSNVDTNEAPVTKFSATQTGSAVYFDGGSTTDADQDYLDYVWQWGDGTNGTGQVNYHTYAQPGQYTVTLTATDPWLATSSMTSQVNVVKPAVYVPKTTSATTSATTATPTTSNAQTTSAYDDPANTIAAARFSAASTAQVFGLMTIVAVVMMM